MLDGVLATSKPACELAGLLSHDTLTCKDVIRFPFQYIWRDTPFIVILSRPYRKALEEAPIRDLLRGPEVVHRAGFSLVTATTQAGNPGPLIQVLSQPLIIQLVVAPPTCGIGKPV